MEARKGMSSGVTVIGAEAPSAYHVAPRSENPNQFTGSAAVNASPDGVGLAGTSGKKKSDRPRKYGPDGAVPAPSSPMPFSSSVPPAGDLSSGKRGKSEQHERMGMENSGEWDASSMGTNFTPHLITVNAGEDVTMKIISFAQQGPRAICILSANGVISNVTLRQPDSYGGTLTYEGRFEILSLSGSFLATETQGTRSRSGGLSVSLASHDDRVVGGGVAGHLVAASPVQVVVGSFLPDNHHEKKVKKQKSESIPATVVSVPTGATANVENEEGMGGHGQQSSSALKPNLASLPSFHRENCATIQEPRNSATDINISLPAD